VWKYRDERKRSGNIEMREREVESSEGEKIINEKYPKKRVKMYLS